MNKKKRILSSLYMVKKKNDKIERAFIKEDIQRLKEKNISDYFLSTSRYHRPWLLELSKQYKNAGIFPVMAMTLLPSYYEQQEDKEVAIFASLLLPVDDDNVLVKVGAFKEMLGASPWEWFEQRKFVGLSLGRNRDKLTGGIRNWKIANLFGRLWDECHIVTYEIPSYVRPLGVQVSLIAKAQRCSYFDVLTYMLEDCCVGNYLYKLRLFLQILACSDGFSLGLWSVDPSELRCPITHDLRVFLQTWFPDYRTFGNIDDAIRLFGFERDYDFFYAYLGYKELQKRNPKECSGYATKYLNWYENATIKKACEWRRCLPKIDF